MIINSSGREFLAKGKVSYKTNSSNIIKIIINEENSCICLSIEP